VNKVLQFVRFFAGFFELNKINGWPRPNYKPIRPTVSFAQFDCVPVSEPFNVFANFAFAISFFHLFAYRYDCKRSKGREHERVKETAVNPFSVRHFV